MTIVITLINTRITYWNVKSVQMEEEVTIIQYTDRHYETKLQTDEVVNIKRSF